MLSYFVFILVNVRLACASPKVPLVPLNDGRFMPALAFGTWLGNSVTEYVEIKGTEVEKAVMFALKCGYRHMDTAWAYQVEDQVGRAVASVIEKKLQVLRDAETSTTPAVCNVECFIKRIKVQEILRVSDDVPAIPREEIFITTKLWNKDHAKEAVVLALKASLSKLQLKYVDLYLIHWPIAQNDNNSYDLSIHYATTWRGMMDAQELGLTRSIGVCNFNIHMLEVIRLRGLRTPAVLQIEWNLNLQQPKLLAYCRQHNITVMGYNPFGSLYAKKDARGVPPPRYTHKKLREIEERQNKTVAQIVLRYALELGVVPVPQSLKTARIEEYIEVFDFELSNDDKVILRSFDKGFRTVPKLQWLDNPFYPFERIATTTTRETVKVLAI